MSDHSHIQWTEATWSPTVGCTHVSTGCDNCYAATLASGRLKHLPEYAGLAEHGKFNGTVRLLEDRLTLPLKWRKPRMIFVDSMSDLFHESVPDEYLAKVWQVMGSAPQHTYQILTKRHGRMRSWVSRWYAGEVAEPERWAEVPGYPGYRINTLGEVTGKRSVARSGLRAEVGEQGHLRVRLYRDGSPRGGDRLLVHRLVLEAFVRRGSGEQVRHLNGDASDNRLSNLRWGTQSDNWHDRLEHGHGRSYSKITGDDAEAIRARYIAGESAYRIAQDYPISDTQVRNIVSGRQWFEQPALAYGAGERALLNCVWLGVSAEDQHWADIRIPALLDTPAAVRFLSAEPLLGPIKLTRHHQHCPEHDFSGGFCASWHPGIVGLDWVIVGGESGRRARPMQLDWARSIRDQCQAAGVAFFMKQVGTYGGTPKSYRELDGRTWDEYPEPAA